jgi:hypothetical protein
MARNIDSEYVAELRQALRDCITSPGSYCLDGPRRDRPKAKERRLYEINRIASAALGDET